jgi:thiamine-monophosphate kinase
LSEQELIQKYFSRHQTTYETVEVGVGDDAAIVNSQDYSKLVITTDTLNVDVHFYADCRGEHVGHKSLAVSLSDIAAMGATPLWATLSLSLPNIDHEWLEKFSNGLYNLADQHNVRLVGGDLVKGPLSITVQVIGYLKTQQQLLRSGCQEDDLIYVSGYLGDAAMGLSILKKNSKLPLSKNDENYFLKKLHTPTPRFDVSNHIAEYATSAIDISDGFLIDLQRMLSMSNKAAVIEVEKIPVSDVMQNNTEDISGVDNLLIGGEDYELIFTIKPEHKIRLEKYFAAENILVTEIGKVEVGSGISLIHNGQGSTLPAISGFDHFS